MYFIVSSSRGAWSSTRRTAAGGNGQPIPPGTVSGGKSNASGLVGAGRIERARASRSGVRHASVEAAEPVGHEDVGNRVAAARDRIDELVLPQARERGLHG